MYKLPRILSTVVTKTKVCLLANFFLLACFSQAKEAAIIDPSARFHPVYGERGMVVSQEMLASQVGADILNRGGNAVDAAVATGFALAVTLPRAGNLGGGGFMMIHLADEGKTIALDYREMAPAAAGRDMFLNEAGEATCAGALSTPRAGSHAFISACAFVLIKICLDIFMLHFVLAWIGLVCS